MCSWLSYVNLGNGSGWTVLDVFCGKANISRLAAKLGFKTASVDVQIPGANEPLKRKRVTKRLIKSRAFLGPQRNLMDMNGHCGFPLLCCNSKPYILLWLIDKILHHSRCSKCGFI